MQKFFFFFFFFFFCGEGGGGGERGGEGGEGRGGYRARIVIISDQFLHVWEELRFQPQCMLQRKVNIEPHRCLQGYTLFFLFLLENIDCEYSLEPPRRGGVTSTHNVCFEQKYENISEFLSKNFHFFGGEIFNIFE